MKRAEEMTDLMETEESQKQAFHEFPQILGNLAKNARFPHSLSSGERFTLSQRTNWPSLRLGRNQTLTTGAPHARGLHSYLTQPTPVRVTSLNELTGRSHWAMQPFHPGGCAPESSGCTKYGPEDKNARTWRSSRQHRVAIIQSTLPKRCGSFRVIQAATICIKV